MLQPVFTLRRRSAHDCPPPSDTRQLVGKQISPADFPSGCLLQAVYGGSLSRVMLSE